MKMDAAEHVSIWLIRANLPLWIVNNVVYYSYNRLQRFRGYQIYLRAINAPITRESIKIIESKEIIQNPPPPSIISIVSSDFPKVSNIYINLHYLFRIYFLMKRKLENSPTFLRSFKNICLTIWTERSSSGQRTISWFRVILSGSGTV